MAAALVILGVIGAVIASTATGQPSDPLPGVALGSEPLLIVERAVAFFAAWMLLVVVVAQALKGRLPTEISGRGVRYADADASAATKKSAEEGVRRLDMEIQQLHLALLKLDKSQHRSEEID